MKRYRSIEIGRYLLALFALALLVTVPARAQSALPPPSKDVVLAAAQGLDPEVPTSLQAVVTKLGSTGYAISVMAGSDGKPSDHKVWWQGQAWTFESSDAYKPGTFRWDPYVQAPYDGSGFSSCGIPTSAKQPCPSWWTQPANSGPQAPGSGSVTPGPTPASGITQAQIDAAVAAVEAHDDANTAKVQAQIDQVVKNAEATGKSIWTWLGPLLGGLGVAGGTIAVARKK